MAVVIKAWLFVVRQDGVADQPIMAQLFGHRLEQGVVEEVRIDIASGRQVFHADYQPVDERRRPVGRRLGIEQVVERLVVDRSRIVGDVDRAQRTAAVRIVDQQGKPIAGAKVERSPNRYAADSWQESTELDPWKIGPRLVGSPKLGYRSIRQEKGYLTVETDKQGRFRFDILRRDLEIERRNDESGDFGFGFGLDVRHVSM